MEKTFMQAQLTEHLKAIKKGREEMAPLTYLGGEGPKYIVSGTIDPRSRTFDTGSKRDDDSNKPLVNHFDAYCRLRFGHLMRAGANKYDKGNWKKGQPVETALESLHRHIAKWEYNYENDIPQDEDHIMMSIFNLQLIAKNEQKAGIKYDHFYDKLK